MQEYRLRYGDDTMTSAIRKIIYLVGYMVVYMLGVKLAHFLISNDIIIGSVILTYYLVGFLVATILGIMFIAGKEE
jgi:hypothetical protein